jgi:hypothetical protein
VLKSEEESDEREGHTPRCFGKSAEEYQNKGVGGDFERLSCAKSAEECENKCVMSKAVEESWQGVLQRGDPPPPVFVKFMNGKELGCFVSSLE